MMVIFVSAIVWVLGLAAEGRLSVEQTTGLLLALVLLMAINPRLGTVIRVLLVLAAAYAFAKRYAVGNWHTQTKLFSSLAELAVLLSGIWVMLRGLVLAFRPPRPWHCRQRGP